MLNAVDVGSVARFLPVIFNQLFHILVVTANEDVSLNVVRYVKLLARTDLTMAVGNKDSPLLWPSVLSPRHMTYHCYPLLEG